MTGHIPLQVIRQHDLVKVDVGALLSDEFEGEMVLVFVSQDVADIPLMQIDRHPENACGAVVNHAVIGCQQFLAEK